MNNEHTRLAGAKDLFSVIMRHQDGKVGWARWKWCFRKLAGPVGKLGGYLVVQKAGDTGRKSC